MALGLGPKPLRTLWGWVRILETMLVFHQSQTLYYRLTHLTDNYFHWTNFGIFPGYLLQFSNIGIEASFHRTSFWSEISWYPLILSLIALSWAIGHILFTSVRVLVSEEYLTTSGAEILIRTGVVAQTEWWVTYRVCESWPLGWRIMIGTREVH